jgi:N-acetylglucosaminyl-diphospho-decaprenol L-rhamnosyltransferase
MSRTSVIVVAFRSAGHLERGLPAVIGDPSVGDVVVVDNSSDSATANLIAETNGRVQYVDPGSNLGFARACNLGASLTRDPVVTFLNPDVLLERGIGDLVEYCYAGDRMLLAGGLTSCLEGGVVGNARRAVTLAGEVGRAMLGSGATLHRLAPGSTTTDVAQVDGAFLMGKREFLVELGGFDERFELYFEDVDLCERARAQGYVFIDTRVFGTHAGGGSSKQIAEASYCAFRVSRIRYFFKKARLRGALAALLITLVETVVRSATLQPEGWRARLRALRLAAQEVKRPGSVQVLS